MKCPHCHKDMPTVRDDTSYDTSKDNKPYKRTTYHCIEDDIWSVLEVPIARNTGATSNSEQ